MSEWIITLGDIEIEKLNFQRYKSLNFIDKKDTDNVLVSNKTSSGEKSYKQFIG